MLPAWQAAFQKHRTTRSLALQKSIIMQKLLILPACECEYILRSTQLSRPRPLQAM